MQTYTPHRITFQWHITDTCNYRCKHCYQSEYTDTGVSFTEQISYLQEFNNFVTYLKKKNPNLHAHINFTGGEPFLRDDFLELLQQTSHLKTFSFGILSNGYLLEEDKLKQLAKLKPRFIQISLEGNEAMNDEIRGKGSFQDITKALKTYARLKIPCIISFTANAQNYEAFPQVVQIARKYKAAKVWTDRYLPINDNDELSMSTEQTKAFFELILKEQKMSKFHIFSKTKVSSNRALQFLVNGGMPYQCSAGLSLFAILPNGDILPCRRLPVKLGNLKEDQFMDIYENHSFIKELRNPELLDKACTKCYYQNSCFGGLKCLSYATTGQAHKKDPNCWI